MLIDCIRPEGQEINRAGMSCGSLNSGPSSLGASASTEEFLQTEQVFNRFLVVQSSGRVLLDGDLFEAMEK